VTAATRSPSGPAADPAQVRAAIAHLQAATAPNAEEQVELRETHISWVFLSGERAFKLKKPLVLPFLDYGTAERRREMCTEEVRLNRRLAADIYLGVCALVPTPAGLELAEDGDAQARAATRRPAPTNQRGPRAARARRALGLASPTAVGDRRLRRAGERQVLPRSGACRGRGATATELRPRA